VKFLVGKRRRESLPAIPEVEESGDSDELRTS
jgi:hypothetical protein